MCIFVGLIAMQRKMRPSYVRALDGLAFAFSLVGLLVLALPSASDTYTPLIIAGITCCGVQSAWNIIRWGVAYAGCSARENLTRMLVAIIAIATIKLATLLFSPLATQLFFAVMLTANFLSARRWPAQFETQRTIVGKGPCELILSYWQIILSISAFIALWSCMNMLFVVGIGHITRVEGISVWAVPLAQVVDIGFAALILCWIHRGRSPIDWSFFWQVAFYLLAFGLLCMPLFGSTRLSQVFTSAASVLVYMFSLYLVVEFDKRSNAPTGTVIAFGFAAISLLDWGGRGLASLLGGEIFQNTWLTPLLIFVILTIIVFFLPARSPAMQLLTTELDGNTDSEAGRAANTQLEKRCSNIACDHGLSARETDILVLLCRGRSTPYIAETLYLSENTVKTYRHRVYQKLGVHNKQELLDMMGV